ncbi:asparagine synthase-related protein [Sphingomicrobium aestuariivivum]|uniref:asparagine synthase-related protein n=1 Tax=Sphingomicrobium aestuariivivum TaxID=1582356 RepID=UPI001FD67421|nr:asparagine synthetase B family protein [Sphingomicrobium aestuariivivum]MCJ8191364.1 asparagine synthetase B family protein [Sphingomicrobium aestuariivivum]
MQLTPQPDSEFPLPRHVVPGGSPADTPPPAHERDGFALWLDADILPDADTLDRILSLLVADDAAAFDLIEGGFAGLFTGPDIAILFRDALGHRPLHYAATGDGRILLARDPLPLARQLGAPRLDDKWLARFFLTLPEEGPRTPYIGVSRVPPGHVVEMRGDEVRVARWWEPDFSALDISFDEALAEATRLLDRGIHRERGDLFLSAGVDSNVILTRLAAMGRSPRAITGSPSAHADPSTIQLVDEYPLAHAGLRSLDLGSEHHRLRAAPSGLRDALNWGFAAFQRPMYNPSNLGWVDGCQALAADLGMNRMLDGMQGNYTLGHNGVRPTIAAAARGQWGRWASLILANGGRDIRASLRAAPPRWLARLLAIPAGWRHAGALFANRWSGDIRAALRPEVDAGIRIDNNADGSWVPERRLREYILQLDPAPRTRAAQLRHGVTLVDPYAQRELVEFCLRLPEHIYRHEGRSRWLQRAMLDPRLPPAIREPVMTAAQGADWRAAALRDAGLMRNILERLEAGHAGAHLFNARAMRRALDDWPASGWDDEDQVIRYRIHLGRAMTCAAFSQWVEDGCP